jgi:hypothetical protein
MRFPSLAFFARRQLQAISSDGYSADKLWRAIWLAFGQYRARHAGQFVGQSHRHDILMGACRELGKPGSETG